MFFRVQFILNARRISNMCSLTAVPHTPFRFLDAPHTECDVA